MSGTKRVSSTAAFKFKVVEFAENSGNERAEKKYRVSVKLVEMGKEDDQVDNTAKINQMTSH